MSNEIENKILNTFAEVASTIGYSPLHGKIIGLLTVRNSPISLNDIAKKTGYSTGMISLSLDLLEVLGVVKKIKKEGDRKLYVELVGDLLESLKKAIVLKVDKSIGSSLSDFEKARKDLKKMSGKEAERAKKTLDILESQLKRLKMYIDLLSEIRLP